MTVHPLVRAARVALIALALTAVAGAARAQEPSPGAIKLARELIELKGATKMWDPIIPGVIEQAKGMFLQTNPGLNKDLNEVTTQIRNEYAPRSGDLSAMVARLYALRFTEPELQEALAFYKTPIGRKIITEEPKVLDDSFAQVQQWAQRFSEEVIKRIREEMKKKGHDL
jgi:uncharacterized protein